VAMASGVYGITMRDILDASQLGVDLVSDTLKVQLVDDTETPDFDAHDSETDITGEITGAGYTAGGATLGSKLLVAGARRVTHDAADPVWTTASFTARGLVEWDDTPAGDPLLCAATFGADFEVVAGTFTAVFDPTGLISVAY
jgi:hypothetical protein